MPAIADAIAERELVWIKPDGERVPITLRIGKPYRTNADDWACPIAAEGFQTKLPDMHGIDSFQALMLAQGLLAKLMAGAVEEGAQRIGVRLGILHYLSNMPSLTPFSFLKHCAGNPGWIPWVVARTKADTMPTMMAERRAPKRIGAK